MLLTLKEDNTTGSFYLCCQLHVLSMMAVYMYPLMVLVTYATTAIFVYMWILKVTDTYYIIVCVS